MTNELREQIEKEIEFLNEAWNDQKAMQDTINTEHHDFIARTSEEYECYQNHELNKIRIERIKNRLLSIDSQPNTNIEKLKYEIDVLRRFGNKDCTAMADEHLHNNNNLEEFREFVEKRTVEAISSTPQHDISDSVMSDEERFEKWSKSHGSKSSVTKEHQWAIWQAALQSHDEWIDVDKELPESGEPVLAFTPNPEHNPDCKILQAGIDDDNIWYDFQDESDIENGSCSVTHWMPLPTPPTNKE